MSPDFPTLSPVTHLGSSTPPRAAAASTSFQAKLSRGLSLASQVVGSAGPVLPGAGLVSLALGGLSRFFGSRGAAGGATGAPGRGPRGLEGLEGLTSGSSSLNMKYLALQESMAREARAYTALSNIMRARHDSAQNAISNIR